jgi:sortase (surface protein transpeptidase)
VNHDRLVLTACHPKYSAAERIVIFARLQDTQQLAWTSVRT